MSDASRDGAGTWHHVAIWQGTLPGAADGAERDVAPSCSPQCRCQEGERGRSSHGHLAWHPGKETARVLTLWLSLGGFSTTPTRDVVAPHSCTSGCTSGSTSASPAEAGAAPWPKGAGDPARCPSSTELH